LENHITAIISSFDLEHRGSTPRSPANEKMRLVQKEKEKSLL